MPFTDHAKNVMLTKLCITDSIYVSAHIAQPVAGGNEAEVTGGTYARVHVTFDPVTGGVADSNNTPVLDIPGGGTAVNYVGFYDALTAGNLLGYKMIPTDVFTNDGTLTLDDIDINLNL